MSAETHHFPLAMKPAPGAVREAAAWFITGDDPARWIAEMITWNVPLSAARLYLLPTGIGNAQPCGVLVLLKNSKPKVTKALPYAQLADRLFFPADAMLDPEISPEEIHRTLLWDLQVLHPSAGLVGFGKADAISVDALISPPTRSASDWTCAQVGVPARPPLLWVTGQAMPSMQDILEMGHDDIGSQAEEDLPPLPDETPVRDAIGNAMSAALRPLMSALARLLSFGSSPGSTSAGRSPTAGKPATPKREPGMIRQWLNRRIQAIANASQELRDRELNRLLGLLKTDPDTGLQFALPLQTIATRGLAPPSNSLGRRSVDFSLSNLFGGNRPADNWAVPADLQRQLRDRYREAANRELNLGRFSRAAYIFAHLLGDFTAAADALKRGRSFREASVIYKDKLNNPKAAADCLVEGGLLLEAISLYRSLELHETAGDLHLRLGQSDEAKECYRMAVDKLVGQRNLVAAARILETKLHDADAAMTILASAWPDSDSAGVCLREWFALCGRCGRDEASVIGRINELRETPLMSSMIVTLVQAFGSAAGSYPSPAVRAAAADSARVLAGNRLPRSDVAERQALISTIVSLAPGDRLLARDGNRFLAPSKVRPALTPIPMKGVSPSLVRSFQLPGDFDWRAVVALPGGFLAFGEKAMRGTLVRGNWQGRMQHEVIFHEATASAYSLVAPSHGAEAVIARLWPSIAEIGIGFPGKPGRFALQATDFFPEDLNVTTPAYIAVNYVGICRDETGTTWVARREESGDVSLSAFAAYGSLLSSHTLTIELDPSEKRIAPLPMAARRGSVYIGWKNQLIRYRADKSQTTPIELPFSICSLAPSPTHTATRMIATFSDGCALVQESGDYRMLAQGVTGPVAAFTPDGSIVAVGKGTGHVCTPRGKEMAFVSTFEMERAPLAVLPAGHGEFAVFDARGTIDVYRINTTHG